MIYAQHPCKIDTGATRFVDFHRVHRLRIHVAQPTTTFSRLPFCYQRHINWHGSGPAIDARGGVGNALEVVGFYTIVAIKRRECYADGQDGCTGGQRSSCG